MSLARASRRGACLNCRFAVNGIQKCSSVSAPVWGFSSFMGVILRLSDQPERSEEGIERIGRNLALCAECDDLEEPIIDDEEARRKPGISPVGQVAGRLDRFR